jgi:hypothetical protein
MMPAGGQGGHLPNLFLFAQFQAIHPFQYLATAVTAGSMTGDRQQ